MKADGKFGEMLLYIESCNSGSLVADLPEDSGVYAMTSTSATGWSWASICPPNDDFIFGKEMNVCLSNLWSQMWMEDTVKYVKTRTIAEQFAATQAPESYEK